LNRTTENEPYSGDQEGRRYTNENRYAIANQRGNSSNCTPKCFAEKGSRVNFIDLLFIFMLFIRIIWFIFKGPPGSTGLPGPQGIQGFQGIEGLPGNQMQMLS
jgi:integrin beta 8